MKPKNAARTERMERLAGFEKTATRVAVGLVIAGPVLALIAGVLGAAEIYPYEYAMTVGLIVMLVPIGLALLIGAVGGLYIMGGLKIAPLGVIFVAGFAALVLGIATADVLWRDLGVGLLAFSGSVFYVFGVISDRTPPAALNRWANAGVFVVGAVIGVVGHIINSWPVLLFGAMAVGCSAGGLVGHWSVRRRSRA